MKIFVKTYLGVGVKDAKSSISIDRAGEKDAKDGNDRSEDSQLFVSNEHDGNGCDVLWWVRCFEGVEAVGMTKVKN